MFPVIYSDQFLEHITGRFHPERPERLKAIVQALQAAPWADRLVWKTPTPVEIRDVMPHVYRVHTPDYVALVRAISERGGGRLDPDTPVSPNSYDVALLAVNSWIDTVDQVLASGDPAFSLSRPPGHHALQDAGMGFCLFSNAAIAAHYALEQPGIDRVAILDWDVHHGNGTQAIIEANPQIAYCSLHQFPAYPGTGQASEQGQHQNVLNLPMAAGSMIADYQRMFEQQVVPFLKNFQPDLLIISAGYDATMEDPLAHIDLRPEDYALLTQYCLQITRRIAFGLEGGYNLPALAEAVVATISPCLIR